MIKRFTEGCRAMDIQIRYTVDGESYAWEKVREFHEFSHSRETFPLVHFNSSLESTVHCWNRETFPPVCKVGCYSRNFSRA